MQYDKINLSVTKKTIARSKVYLSILMLKSYSKSSPNCNGDCGVNRSAVLCAVLVHWTAALSDSTGTTSNKTTQTSRVTSMLQIQYASACQILRPVRAQSQIFESGRARIRGVV